MKNDTKDMEKVELEGEKEEDSKDIPESDEIVKKTEKVPVGIPVKYTRPPAFIKSGNLSRWNLKTSNNRQRPGRAAWRGR